MEEIQFDKQFKLKEAAKIFSVSVALIAKLCNRGDLVFMRVGEKAKRIPGQSILDYIERNTKNRKS